MISKEQCRMARACLEWDRKKLAQESGVSEAQIRNFENGETESPRHGVLQDLTNTFARHHLAFVEGGVVPRKYGMRVLQGQQGFWDFYDDVYETVRAQGGNILISNVDEKVFWKWLGERRQMHKERMEKLDNFVQKIIVKEGTSELLTNYITTSYRELPANQFSGIPFYLYGSKLAIINFQPDDVQIFVIDEPHIAAAYEKMFFGLWDEVCHEPGKKGGAKS